MPIKILGAVMIFSSGVILGYGKAYVLAQRERSLININSAFGILESEIVFSQNKLKTAFERIAQISSCGRLFLSAAEKMEESSACDAWIYATEKEKHSLCLTQKDAEILKMLANELGRSDKEQQIKNIRHVSALLKAAAEEAHNEYAISAKMYRSGGICVGLFLAVLLM